MSIVIEQRLSESPYIEWVAHGYTTKDAIVMRPAEATWHLIFTQKEGIRRILLVGALEEAKQLRYAAGAESLWIRFRVGTFMPHLSALTLLNHEIELPQASGHNFWLKDQVWEIPNFENVDTFVNQLARQGIVTCNPIVTAALCDEMLETPARTLRYHFQQSTGLRQNHIRQIIRAQSAAELLQRGTSILDTVHELGYADQPHLTRSLKRFFGYTPNELLPVSNPSA